MKKYAVYFLQEVHCSKDKEHIWSTEWGYSAIRRSFSSASAGVCVLFNNNFNFQILKSFSDPEGRFVMVDIKLESKILNLVNIYAPNEDKPTFFQNVLNQLLCFECSEIILDGDFQCLMSKKTKKVICFQRLLITLILRLFITEPTRITLLSSTLIDVIFTYLPDNTTCSGESHIGISDHSLIYVYRKISSPSVIKGTSTI